jgi:outer membrane immunogenic protein
MKKSILGLVAISALIAGPAMAADLRMPVKAPYAPPPVVTSWTGFYIGVNGGYGWNKDTGSSTCVNPTGGSAGCDFGVGNVARPSGGLFGGQIGYNWQTGPAVFGIETDLQWADISGSGSAPDLCCQPVATPASTGTFAASSKLDWFGTVRGRLGFTIGNNALLYGTGGLIYGHETVSDSLTFPTTGFVYPASTSTTRTGATVGAGLEYLFTPAFSAKIEGLWYDMGSLNSTFTCPAGSLTCTPGYTIGGHFNFSGAIVRGGLNYHFNLGGEPVATRY